MDFTRIESQTIVCEMQYKNKQTKKKHMQSSISWEETELLKGVPIGTSDIHDLGDWA